MAKKITAPISVSLEWDQVGTPATADDVTEELLLEIDNLTIWVGDAGYSVMATRRL